MIFLSAQPDEFYFSWQLELQLFNFSRLGIPANRIHVLIAYDPKRGPNPVFLRLAEEHGERGTFYFYPDLRASRQYKPSVRPHIIRRHLEVYPELQRQTIFYHDSDIIFRERPALDNLVENDTWYVSDTRSYLATPYIRSTAGDQVFSGMCALMDVREETIVEGDKHSGGAQYLLKRTSLEFWERIERDCTAIYCYLEDENNRNAELALAAGKRKSSYSGIQSWCADMWALYWNALKDGKSVEITKELDFCWANSPIAKWRETNILHYSGNITAGDARYFRKNNYTEFPPYYDAFIHKITPDNCSYPLKELIVAFYAERAGRLRTDLRNTTFLIPANIDSKGALTNLVVVLRNLHHCFNTTVLLAETGSKPWVEKELLPPDTVYFHLPDMDDARAVNFLVRQASTDVIALNSAGVIMHPGQIARAADAVASGQADMVIPHEGECLQLDRVFSYFMLRHPQPQILIDNRRKFNMVTGRAAGGCVLVNREKFLSAGMENERLSESEQQAAERVKRFRNLGYMVRRGQGPLFQLPVFPRAAGDGYNRERLIAHMEEYLKVCNMKKTELRDYVQSWPWVSNLSC